ncbi:MAG: efflux transporter outer membrane subunit [Desulfobacterales bacterium]|nr:efflux transporter outer membrane subunit [Desulfobacterales bacterium]
MKIYRTLLLLTAAGWLLILTGCSVHQPGEYGFGPLPEAYSEKASGGENPAASVGRWWERFKDRKLNMLVEEALAGNLDVAQAYARLDQVAAIQAATQGARQPTLILDGRAARSRQYSAVGEGISSIGSLSMAASYEIDLWQKLRSQREAARLKTLASQEAVFSIYLGLTTRLVDLYYQAVEQRAQLQLMDASVASHEETVARVEARYRAGIATALDLYQARRNLAAAKARQPLAVAGLARIEHSLAVLMGKPPAREIAGDLAILPPAPVAFAAGLPADLLSRRPDIRAAALKIKAQDAEVAATIADRFPSFNLIADYGRTNLALGSTGVTGAFWSLLMSFSQPIFDGGRRRAEVERNQALLRERVAAYQQTVLNAFQEVEDSLIANRTTEERLELLGELETVAGANLRNSEQSYFQGVGDYLPILVAQRGVNDVKSRLLAAQRQLISDRISLVRALAGDWLRELPPSSPETGVNTEPQNIQCRRKK